MTNDTL